MRYGYVKAKDIDGIEAQVNELLSAWEIDRMVIDQTGDKLETLIGSVKYPDEIFITELYRISRDVQVLHDRVMRIAQKNVDIVTSSGKVDSQKVREIYESLNSLFNA